jgi:hypothetical protein
MHGLTISSRLAFFPVLYGDGIFLKPPSLILLKTICQADVRRVGFLYAIDIFI